MVANRIAMIHEGSEVSSWRHVKSNLNPADDASRGMSVESIIGRSRWSMGPGFLSQTEEHWPEQPECVATLESDHPEVKKSCATVRPPCEYSRTFLIVVSAEEVCMLATKISKLFT